MVLCCKEPLLCKAPRDNARALAFPCSVALSLLTMPPPCALVHHQALLQHPASTKPGADCMGRRLKERQGEVLLSAPSHCLANAAPCLCLLQRPSASVLVPLYPPFCPDNRSSSSSSWHPGGLCRQLPSLRSSLTPLRTGRRRHHQQLLFPPIPSPSLP